MVTSILSETHSPLPLASTQYDVLSNNSGVLNSAPVNIGVVPSSVSYQLIEEPDVAVKLTVPPSQISASVFSSVKSANSLTITVISILSDLHSVIRLYPSTQ